ncbi:uncharacterized protein LOC135491982 isoform X3 [Lineus longissimus]|uniref:uncharacterized protein LOC135491982 isoform X3 n=1 Tax=Lineus longissimus TaxID=88925 RepID=UPI00315D80E2
MDIIDSAEFPGVLPVIECGAHKGRRGSTGMIDPSQPSPQARALVNNKNNLADMTLRKTLAQVEREKVASITELDHERLEVLDFLRNLKRCDSDRDPTYLKYLKKPKDPKPKDGAENEAVQGNDLASQRDDVSPGGDAE